MPEPEGKNGKRVHIELAIPQRNLFGRDQPAELEGPADAWELAKNTIDFGGALLMAWKTIRPESSMMDAVLSALLRRLLVTGEATRVLLSVGLLEPAIAQSRTVLEIELALRLILADASGVMAKRLAAYHYLTYQRHGQDQLGDPTTKNRAREANRVGELAKISGSYKRFLELPIFDEVRKDVRAKRSWHGHDSVEDAFAAAGEPSDYYILYDAQTWFVHAVNVDFDFVERTDSQLVLKSLVERAPTVIQVQLGHLLLRLVTAYRLIADWRGYPTDPPFDHMSKVTYPNGRVEQINALDALTGQLTETFRTPSQ